MPGLKGHILSEFIYRKFSKRQRFFVIDVRIVVVFMTKKEHRATFWDDGNVDQEAVTWVYIHVKSH